MVSISDPGVQPAGQGRRAGLRWGRISAVLLALLLVLSGAGGSLLYARPLPAVSNRLSLPHPAAPPATVSMPWPSYGQAAVGLAGSGVLASSPGDSTATPLPTASTAKVMAALAVLDKKPLSPGQSGPVITLTQADVDIYNYYYSRDGSLAAVQAGEQISEYDALQALMLPSANNFADSLAIWAFGSLDAYLQYANATALTYGMAHTHFADASGFSPQTVSTADDLVRLGERALANPVLSEIMAKRQAQIPVAGTIYNVNGLLGKDGINGIKTGNTDQAGGVFLGSAERQLANGQKGTVIACIMGAPSLDAAMLATVPLLETAANNIVSQTLIKKGQVFGNYTAPWDGQPAKAVASHDVTLTAWKGAPAKISANLAPLGGPRAAGANASRATATVGSASADVPLILDRAVQPPSWWWRVSHR